MRLGRNTPTQWVGRSRVGLVQAYTRIESELIVIPICSQQNNKKMAIGAKQLTNKKRNKLTDKKIVMP